MFHRLILCVLFEGLTWMMQLGSTWKSAGTFSHKPFWSLFFLQSVHSITWGWINLSIRETKPFNNTLIIYKCFACFCFVVLGWGFLLPYTSYFYFVWIVLSLKGCQFCFRKRSKSIFYKENWFVLKIIWFFKSQISGPIGF